VTVDAIYDPDATDSDDDDSDDDDADDDEEAAVDAGADGGWLCGVLLGPRFSKAWRRRSDGARAHPIARRPMRTPPRVPAATTDDNTTNGGAPQTHAKAPRLLHERDTVSEPQHPHAPGHHRHHLGGTATVLAPVAEEEASPGAMAEEGPADSSQPLAS